MESKYTFLDLAIEILEITKTPLSAHEIWKEAVKLNLDIKLNSKGKTPWQTIGAKIYVSIKTDVNSPFIRVEDSPVKFSLKKYETTFLCLGNDKKTDDEKPKKYPFIERDIHPLLTKYVFSNEDFECYCKTIYHETSKNGQKGANEWLHPDIVGIRFPFENYNNEVRTLQESFKANFYKLYSFEMKPDLTMSTLRKYYFQAVSNSSWANEGYLVVLNLKQDEELIAELKRLTNSFGIGVIQLNAECTEESRILFPAKCRENIDWDTVNRLSLKNKDFKEFILNINEDIKLGKPKSNYDEVLDEEQYANYIKSKHIKNTNI